MFTENLQKSHQNSLQILLKLKNFKYLMILEENVGWKFCKYINEEIVV